MVMEKNTTLFILPRLLITLFLGFSMQSYQGSVKTEIPTVNYIPEHSILTKQTEKQDKNLLKGVWGRTDATGVVNISEVLDNGLLKTTFYSPKMINIEKAVWTNSSDVLRIYILLREDNYPGSSFSLNYMAEKDLLLGVYFDALTNESLTISFERIK
jgi:hypothetical protein